MGRLKAVVVGFSSARPATAEQLNETQANATCVLSVLEEEDGGGRGGGGGGAGGNLIASKTWIQFTTTFTDNSGNIVH